MRRIRVALITHRNSTILILVLIFPPIFYFLNKYQCILQGRGVSMTQQGRGDTTKTMTKSICNIHFFSEAHHKGTPARFQGKKKSFRTENRFSCVQSPISQLDIIISDTKTREEITKHLLPTAT